MAKNMLQDSGHSNCLGLIPPGLALIIFGGWLLLKPGSLSEGSSIYNRIYWFWHPWRLTPPPEDTLKLTLRQIKIYAWIAIIIGSSMVFIGLLPLWLPL